MEFHDPDPSVGPCEHIIPLCLLLYVSPSPLLWLHLNLAFPSFTTRLPSAASFNDLIGQMQFIS